MAGQARRTKNLPHGAKNRPRQTRRQAAGGETCPGRSPVYRPDPRPNLVRVCERHIPSLPLPPDPPPSSPTPPSPPIWYVNVHGHTLVAGRPRLKTHPPVRERVGEKEGEGGEEGVGGREGYAWQPIKYWQKELVEWLLPHTHTHTHTTLMHPRSWGERGEAGEGGSCSRIYLTVVWSQHVSTV